MEFGLIGVAIAIPCLLLALADRKKIIAAKREEFVEETRNLILTQAQKQDTELEPCPFCRADSCNLSIKVDEIGPFIYCACCDAVYTIANGTIEQIIKGWNRRMGE